MEKFVILYKENLHGAVVGTESGQVLTITKAQRHNQQWIDKHTSKKIKVYKISDKNTFSTPDPNTDFLIDKKFDDIGSDISLEIYRATTSNFDVAFHACFIQNKNVWVIEEKPISILPL